MSDNYEYVLKRLQNEDKDAEAAYNAKLKAFWQVKPKMSYGDLSEEVGRILAVK